MKDIYDLITDYFSEDHDIRVAKNLLQAYESQRSTEGTTSVNKLNLEASEGLGEATVGYLRVPAVYFSPDASAEQKKIRLYFEEAVAKLNQSRPEVQVVIVPVKD